MDNYDQFMVALEQGNLTAAARLLKRWKQHSVDDPWFRLAAGRYFEATHNFQKATSAYLFVLQQGGQTRLVTQARQGIQRIQDSQARAREQDLTEAKAQPGAETQALLFLEPVTPEARQVAGQGLAQVMQMDAYTARMLIPGKHWRLYRVGSLGELQYFGQQLQENQTPAFWVTLAQIKALPVFQVHYVEQMQSQVTVVCQNPSGQLGKITFSWQEVSQRVTGKVPIFESVVDIGPWGKLQRKQQTQDYAEVVDLHLYGRGSILRFCDRTYQYRQGVSLGTTPQQTPPLIAQQEWQQLKGHLMQQQEILCHRGFSGFGDSALEFLELLPPLDSHLALNRREPSPWDLVFHLYSCLCYLRYAPKTSNPARNE